MTIKEKIGKRIKDERLAKGLTRKALAELTQDLNVSRINNYERGERTPGPNEIKQLAKVLDVSPAFLMCLSDDKFGKLNKTPGTGALVPILDYKKASNPKQSVQEIREGMGKEELTFIPINSELASKISQFAFALQVKDVSMTPELKINDVLIFDPDIRPSPSDLVVAKLGIQEEVVIRKYKQLSTSESHQDIELIALNDDWANARINHENPGEVIGTLIYLTRQVKVGF